MAERTDAAASAGRRAGGAAALRGRLGAGLVLAASVCMLWLGLTGRLSTYIHPRYTVFTTVMAGIALVMAVLALWQRDAAEHRHEHDGPDEERPAWRARLARVGALAAGIVCVVVVGALVILPPTALTTATADDREVNSGSLLTASATVELTSSGDTSGYGLREWATLLRQSTHPESLIGTPFTGVGFVTASDDDEVFLLTRFVVSCCAVDAQPVAVSVYAPGWRDALAEGDWVSVDGALGTPRGGDDVIVLPDDVSAIEQPAEPYEY